MNQSYFFTLVGILNNLGWSYLYMMANKGRTKKEDSTTYYLVPTTEDAASFEICIDSLANTFGTDTTYIYEVIDVTDIWMLKGRRMLQITLPNK